MSKSFTVAVLPCWKNHGHQHEYDKELRAIGADVRITDESKDAMDALFADLDAVDMLIAPPLFHFDKGRVKDPEWRRPYDFADYTASLRAWIENGGVLLVTDANYDVCLSWLKDLEPSLALESVSACAGHGAEFTDASDIISHFPHKVDIGSTFAHLVPQKDSPWKVLAKCGDNAATLLAWEHGDGLLVLDNQRAEAIAGIIDNLRIRQALLRQGLKPEVTDRRLFEVNADEAKFDITLINRKPSDYAGEVSIRVTPVPEPYDDEDDDDIRKITLPAPVEFSDRIFIAAGERRPLSISAKTPGGKARVEFSISGCNKSATLLNATARFSKSGENGLLAVAPSVFAVGNDYIIGVLAVAPCAVAVRIGPRTFWDEHCGIRNSSRPAHMIRVPQGLLESEGGYTVAMYPVIDRNPYYTSLGDTEEHRFEFRGAREDGDFRIIAIGDSHNSVDEPVAAAAKFKDDADLLVLAGDIADDGGKNRSFETIYRIAGRITGGAWPCVYVRGNHEVCGRAVEHFRDLAPTDNGCPYFTFRLGEVMGIVLDTAGMENPFSNEGGSVLMNFHSLRLEQDEWIGNVIHSPEWDNAKKRVLIAHIPFFSGPDLMGSPERDLYASWSRQMIDAGLDVAITGHEHRAFIETPDEHRPDGILPCLHVCSTERTTDSHSLFTISAITIGRNDISVDFCDGNGNIRRVYQS